MSGGALFEFRPDRYRVVSRSDRWFVYDPDLGQYTPARTHGDAGVVASLLNKAQCTKKSYYWFTEREVEGKVPSRLQREQL